MLMANWRCGHIFTSCLILVLVCVLQNRQKRQDQERTSKKKNELLKLNYIFWKIIKSFFLLPKTKQQKKKIKEEEELFRNECNYSLNYSLTYSLQQHGREETITKRTVNDGFLRLFRVSLLIGSFLRSFFRAWLTRRSEFNSFIGSGKINIHTHRQTDGRRSTHINLNPCISER